jgi:hypothetical protein
MSWVIFATDNQSVIQSILVLGPSVTPDQIFAYGYTVRGSCYGASSLTGGRVFLLHSTLYWSLLHWILWSLLYPTSTGVFFTGSSEFSFTRLSTGVFFTGSSGVSFTRPLLESSSLDHLESPLLDPLLESSSLDPPWSLLDPLMESCSPSLSLPCLVCLVSCSGLSV